MGGRVASWSVRESLDAGLACGTAQAHGSTPVLSKGRDRLAAATLGYARCPGENFCLRAYPFPISLTIRSSVHLHPQTFFLVVAAELF
jgi:hypothetical protein